MLGLRTCIYLVKDINLAKKWYAKAFETKPYFEESSYVGFNIGGFELGLQPEEKPEVKSQNVQAYWGVNNITAEYNRLIKLGATPLESPNNVGGELMVATILDPWDNVIGLIYNPEFNQS